MTTQTGTHPTPDQHPGTQRSVSIGNASGFYGDRLAAFTQMAEAGVDVITGDYLAELTMLILARQKAKDPQAGFAKTFLLQLTDNLQTVAANGTKVVVNAGGMNPGGLAAAISAAAADAGLDIPIAYIDGDDLTDRAEELDLGTPLAANAYLGGWGITQALAEGAQIVITGRVTDAALITGSAAWFHGWEREDYDRLAGTTAAGHVIECGMQATGGNFSFFTEIADLERPGFPIAEIAADGSSVITKPAGTGGAVTVETVLSQLLYEIAGARYPGPDATLRLDSIRLTQEGPDRVLISDVHGEAPPPDLKVSATEIGGFRQQLTIMLSGLNIEAKAELIKRQFSRALEIEGLPTPAEMSWTLARTDHPGAADQERASARLHLVARDENPKVVGRKFANLLTEFALGSIPGFFSAAPPSEASVYGRFTPLSVPQDVPAHTVHAAGREDLTITPPSQTRPLEPTEHEVHSAGHSQSTSAAVGHGASEAVGDFRSHDAPAQLGPDEVVVPLGQLFGGRSGDKGGGANIGLWARSDEAWEWLRTELTAERLRQLLPELAPLDIDRTELPNLHAINFVIHGLLGEGVAYAARFDAQAKGLAEWLRARPIAVPRSIVPAEVLQDLDAASTTGPSTARQEQPA